MPHVVVKLAAGRPDELKRRLAAELSRTVDAVVACGEDAVSVAIEDVPQRDWMQAVYEPEIAGRPETLFKKPGYGPR